MQDLLESRSASYSSTSSSGGTSVDTSLDTSIDAAHVMFVSIGHPGQTNPMLAIAQAFRNEYPKNKVTFATSKDLQSTIKEEGFDFLSVWTSAKLPSSLVEAMNNAGVRSVECMLQWALFSRSEETYTNPRKIMSDYIRQYQPSLIICDSLSEAGMAAAIDTNTKFIINSPTPPYICFPDCVPRFFPTTGTGTSQYKTSLWHSIHDFAVSFRYKLGLYKRIVPMLLEERKENDILLHHESANAAALFINNTSELFSDPRVRWPQGKMKWIGVSLRDAQARLTESVYFEDMWKEGREAGTTSERELITWIDQVTSPSSSTQPLVLVALGTLYKLDRSRIESIYFALSSLPIKVIWKINHREQALLPPEAIPNDNFRFETWISDFMLLLAHPRLSLFVNHAGGNSLHEGLYFGKPMVCIPGWMDCFDFAIHCQDLGAGITIDTAPKLDSLQFKNAVHQVLFGPEAETFTLNARKIAADLKSLGGAKEAVKIIGEFMQGRMDADDPTTTKEVVSEVEQGMATVLVGLDSLLPPC
ncbi:hypothetical protein CBS101457_002435 [Exobasidium rhododendri]|nr:hypothetical protein CBS101457_002435 [Exobasidium rhododendri]